MREKCAMRDEYEFTKMVGRDCVAHNRKLSMDWK
jgi:hypothetical protein